MIATFGITFFLLALTGLISIITMGFEVFSIITIKYIRENNKHILKSLK